MTNPFSRRSFLATGAFGAAGALATHAGAKPFGEVITDEPFARIEKVGENIWAAVSLPLNPDGSFNPLARKTLCNGGIIAGKDKVVAIDGFFEPAGGAWLAGEAEKLTGRPVTDVIVTHFHADHTGGLAGFQRGAQGPDIIGTQTTHNLIFERYAQPTQQEGAAFATPVIRPVLPTKIITDETKTTSLDLGGRTITLDPLSGHTPSDLAVWVDDAPVIFAGDLVWAGIFHNYVDAIPSQLRRSVAKLLEDKTNIIVTGHGHVAKAGDLQNYLALLDHVEEAARASHKAGKTPAEGSADYAPPASLGEWRLFSLRYYETAFTAWARELDGAPKTQ